ncbi:ribonuclease HII [Geothrix fermentans]|jgi:ribonuclease HII|uniref:ribonuclease HII n=1 Tax=Geothrix fermentans TaxID=44676 RepID=UPI0004161004|nr:ribonuclease HII [Geothrix fermentans]
MNPLDWDLGNVPPGVAWGGVDEAGRGAWAGPVVAACAVLDADTARRWGHVLRGVRDSKQLTPGKREVLAAELRAILPAYGIAEVDPMAIDRENILEATLMAMRQAAKDLALRPRILFVDGNRAPGTGLLERMVVDGDAISCAIGAASILAKAHRDALMIALEEEHPGYGFGQHKGYGTALHRARIAELGVSPIHRISYAPVAALQRVDEDLREDLRHSLDRCTSVAELRAWVETDLRPAYGRLKLVWVETLRRRYADRLAQFATEEEGLE